MAQQSLRKRQNVLSKASKQLEYLSNGIFKDDELPTFQTEIDRI
jgi:collagenase-like PrtC family protease